MRIKRDIVRNLKNIYWQLKGIGIFNLVPVLGLYVGIPLANLMAYSINHDMDYLYVNIVKQCHFLPDSVCLVCYFRAGALHRGGRQRIAVHKTSQ